MERLNSIPLMTLQSNFLMGIMHVKKLIII
jgi:hypothetical protein